MFALPQFKSVGLLTFEDEIVKSFDQCELKIFRVPDFSDFSDEIPYNLVYRNEIKEKLFGKRKLFVSWVL